MKKIMFMVLLFSGVFSYAQEKKESGGKESSVTGEVIDMYCYIGHGSKGDNHKACAEMCAKSGLPLGLLDEKGNVYIVITSNHVNANEKLMSFVAKKVTVKGKEIKKGGVNAIELNEVALAK